MKSCSGTLAALALLLGAPIAAAQGALTRRENRVSPSASRARELGLD